MEGVAGILFAIGAVLGWTAIRREVTAPSPLNAPSTDRLMKAAAACIVAGMLVLLGSCAAEAKSDPSRIVALRLCMPWVQLKSSFERYHKEVPIGGGVVNERTALRVLVSPGGETWSLVEIDISGMACLVGGGRGWDPGSLPIAGKDT